MPRVSSRKAPVAMMRSLTSARRQTLRKWAGVFAIVVVGVILGSVWDDYALFTAATVLAFAIAAMGQGILVGKAGQVSIGGAAFLYIGALVTAKTDGTILAVFPITLILAGLAGAAVGLVIGLPALRLRELYLLLITLALHFVVQFMGVEVEKGHAAGFPAPTFQIGSWSAVTGKSQFYVVLAVAVVVGLVFTNLYQRAPGQMWAALAEDQVSAATMGVSVVRWKLIAFVISSAVTAMAGSLLASLVGSASYQTFTLDLAISLLVMVFLGGAQSVIGVCLGAFIIRMLPVWLTDVTNALGTTNSVAPWLAHNSQFLNSVIYGLALFFIVLYARRGVVGALESLLRWTYKKTVALFRPASVAYAGPEEIARPRIHTEQREEGASAPVSAEVSPNGLLVLTDVHVRYPNGAHAVDGVTFSLEAGAVGALVGRNGAGKTSLLRAIAGFTRTEGVRVRGSMRLDGRQVDGLSADTRAEHGIVIVPESDKVFPSLTPVEHLRLVGVKRAGIDEIFDRYPVLARRPHTPAGLLSGGQRQLLALAMSTVRSPKLLLVDEVTQGLAPIAIQEFLEQLARARQGSDMTVLLSDQSAVPLEAITSTVLHMEHGVLSGPSRTESGIDTRERAKP